MSASAEAPKSQNIQTTLKSVVSNEAPKGHPKGLYILFFTEMWERFGYYGMRALLVLYMINYLQWQPAQSSGVYKWYTSLVYLTPLFGGFIADRFMGLRLSVIVGGLLMAVGYLTLTVESLFYPALGLIIAGNGFFKPNISTMVGKMYKMGDGRRDGAFTIFYMGINLGAGAAPFVCAWLRSRFGFKYGFAAAGVGMILGLVIFLVGQARVLKDVEAAGNDLKIKKKDPNESKTNTLSSKDSDELSEPGTGGLAGLIAKVYPLLMIGLAVGVPVFYGIRIARGEGALKDAIMPIAFGLIAGVMGYALMTIKGAARDRSTVIFILFMFAVLFWMAFEQAGNALNIWADVNTDRHVFSFEYPAEWFQSVNAVFIFTLAPLFAILWTFLARANKEPPTAVKMLLAMVFMVTSFGAMVWGAAVENRTVSHAQLSALPAGIESRGGKLWVAPAKDEKEPALLDAGRLTYDPATHELSVRGVLPQFATNMALSRTASPEWVAEVEKLEKAAEAGNPVTLKLALPKDFELTMPDKDANEAGFSWSKESGELSLTKAMNAPTKTALLNAGAPAEWRKAVSTVESRSLAARVGGVWLFLSYLLATLGELCLSPVGLSMVTKLAPARFASLFMGVWLLASSVAQYVGGAIGESWGLIPPTDYFMLFVWTSVIGVLALVVLVMPIRKLMHRVH